jgi:hypothetical protein
LELNDFKTDWLAHDFYQNESTRYQQDLHMTIWESLEAGSGVILPKLMLRPRSYPSGFNECIGLKSTVEGTVLIFRWTEVSTG